MPDTPLSPPNGPTDIERIAQDCLHLWPVPPDARISLLNLSENATYLVEASGYRTVLRVHRAGYHGLDAIGQELAWAQALADDGVVLTPQPIAGVNGRLVQRTPPLQGQSEGLSMVLFAHIQGQAPDENDDLVALFLQLGSMAARMHLHAQDWVRPQPFRRLSWDADAIFGAGAKWGDWRDAPNLTAPDRAVLDQAEALIRQRLATFGKTPDRYGLIHADMRLANLLIDGKTTRLIDFDDCGTGWFLYDFAASISFFENHPQIPALRRAWVQGYRRIRPLDPAQEYEIDTFVMLRRLALLAWIGSHAESPEPQALAPDFARVSAELARDYLRRFGPPLAPVDLK